MLMAGGGTGNGQILSLWDFWKANGNEHFELFHAVYVWWSLDKSGVGSYLFCIYTYLVSYFIISVLLLLRLSFIA